jgi:hypothetical protein
MGSAAEFGDFDPDVVQRWSDALKAARAEF